MPDIAEGSTTSLMVSNLVAPTAKAASRVLFGIRFNASSVVVIMYGNDNNPKVKPAANNEVRNCKACTNKAKPNKPKIIDGTPDKFLIEARMVFVNQLFSAYSLR